MVLSQDEILLTYGSLHFLSPLSTISLVFFLHVAVSLSALFTQRIEIHFTIIVFSGEPRRAANCT